ncbi:MAG TPA: hypothetical protein VGI39_04760 [Polyangiaceae bacterium]|jgi:hypothetical protein
MIPSVQIDGPLGPFAIPAEPADTQRICAGLSRGVWGFPGAYDWPEARVPEYEHPALTIPGIRRILDVGAGWGAFAVWAVARWGHEIELDCYEPSTKAADFIFQNLFSPVTRLSPTSFAVRIHRVAVSVTPEVVLGHSLDWGSRKTHLRTEGHAGDGVATLHPQLLPPCDILKCDAEGIEPELFLNYPHLASVKAAIYEWHSPDHRASLGDLCERAGLHCVRDEDGPWGGGNGVGIWVR